MQHSSLQISPSDFFFGMPISPPTPTVGRCTGVSLSRNFLLTGPRGYIRESTAPPRDLSVRCASLDSGAAFCSYIGNRSRNLSGPPFTYALAHTMLHAHCPRKHEKDTISTRGGGQEKKIPKTKKPSFDELNWDLLHGFCSFSQWHVSRATDNVRHGNITGHRLVGELNRAGVPENEATIE